MLTRRRTRRITALALLTGCLGLAPLQAAQIGTRRTVHTAQEAVEALRTAWTFVQALWLGNSNPPPGQVPPGPSGPTPNSTTDDPPEGSGLDPYGKPKP